MKAEQLSLFESKISPEYLVTQSNSLIEAPQNLTLQEKRIILTLASLVQPEDDNFRVHRIKVKDLADIIGIKEKNFYSKVESVVEKLQNKTITIETERSKLNMHWLSSSEYFKGQGYVELEFSEKLRPFLLELKQNYTPFKLRNVLQLRSEYYIRIYELLKQYEKLKKRAFSISELKFHLNIPPDKYEKYAHLKSRIILKAQSELTENTDLTFDFEERKEGRKVVGIIFYIKKNQKLLKEVIGNEKLDSNSSNLLIRFGVRPDKAREIVKEYSEEQINQNINYILETKNHLEIDNISGYVIAAIENNYVEKGKLKSTDFKSVDRFSVGQVQQWLKGIYRHSRESVPSFLVEEKVIDYIVKEGFQIEEALEFWNEHGTNLNQYLRDLIKENRLKKK
ncbi:replication initiation protein [Alkalihalobacillus oceani]|uniref:Replication initiation protein n=1 Tax=Halalkalibacter oceani TaxID=1653776 RepID=A0A9X2IQ16_9BACI|nr:replication initiation protein [Halalkalibacter oceani]MCM3715431.1 replication initiation protein [Halalkalibacter oceani]